MKTNIQKTFQIDQPIERVWDFLSNPTKIVVCVPGASITEEIDDRNYKGQVALKFGPVSAKYNGQITIEELDDANKKMRLKGKGMDAKGKGSADMIMNGELTEKDGGTEVNYSMEISITGMLAQFGSRLINDVSNQVVEQFIGNFKKELSKAAPAPAAETPTAPVAETVADAPSHTAAAAAKAAPPPPAPDPEPAADNSINAFALMWAVIKGFFARLFGGAK